jgi:8-oxo-dGTP pyrophosphatase MutT (NUDIX family)
VENFVERVEKALSLPNFDWRAAQTKMGIGGRVMGRPREMEGEGRRSAVMLLLYPHDGQVMVVYTLRPKSLRTHSGQISFPGGRIDDGETASEAALREVWEELGIKPTDIQLIGSLAKLYIPPSDFFVEPFVGWCAARPDFRPNPSEVAALIEVSLDKLLDPTTRQIEKRRFPVFDNAERDVPFFAVDEYKIWGATALMTGEFLERWKQVD